MKYDTQGLPESPYYIPRNKPLGINEINAIVKEIYKDRYKEYYEGWK